MNDSDQLYTQLVIPSKHKIPITLEGFTKKISKTTLDEKLVGKRLVLNNPKRPKKKSWKNQLFTTKNKNNINKKEHKANELVKEQEQEERIMKWIVASELHSLWQEYIKKVMTRSTDKLTSWLKADWQGAKIKIIKSHGQPYLILLDEVIIIRETKNLFHVIDKDDRRRKVIKKGLVFQIDNVRLFGDHLLMAPAIRSTKKFKTMNA